mmetsp:Transcript_31051/g.35471  ORF Transcript_31051/g.35471 Transcript_31051/m.35471 type:complete len:207 (-) Transcript_31051:8-628(-)
MNCRIRLRSGLRLMIKSLILNTHKILLNFISTLSPINPLQPLQNLLDLILNRLLATLHHPDILHIPLLNLPYRAVNLPPPPINLGMHAIHILPDLPNLRLDPAHRLLHLLNLLPGQDLLHLLLNLDFDHAGQAFFPGSLLVLVELLFLLFSLAVRELRRRPLFGGVFGGEGVFGEGLVFFFDVGGEREVGWPRGQEECGFCRMGFF